MPKLFQINSSLNKGSTGRIAEQIALLSQSIGWETYIAHGARYQCASIMKNFQVVTKLGEILHALKSVLFDAHGLGSEKATWKLIDEIERVEPDIIHIHNLHGYYINYKVLFKYLQNRNVPIVWTLHDCWAMTGHCCHFDLVGCGKWKTECYDCVLRAEYPKSLYLDKSRYNYRLKKELFTSVPNMTIVPVSEWMGSIVRNSYLNRYPINVINNGVDLSVFRPRENDLRTRFGLKDKIVLLGVATAWGINKGLKDYIRLSSILSAEYQIILVGISQEQKKQIPPNIITIERTENQIELAEFYTLADIVLNLSYQESFGLTTVEGLACGTPGIVYNKTASPELVSPKCGIIVEAGNMKQLVSAIQSMKKNGKSFYSSACQERAEMYFDKNKCFRQYVELYEELLREKEEKG